MPGRVVVGCVARGSGRRCGRPGSRAFLRSAGELGSNAYNGASSVGASRFPLSMPAAHKIARSGVKVGSSAIGRLFVCRQWRESSMGSGAVPCAGAAPAAQRSRAGFVRRLVFGCTTGQHDAAARCIGRATPNHGFFAKVQTVSSPVRGAMAARDGRHVGAMALVCSGGGSQGSRSFSPGYRLLGRLSNKGFGGGACSAKASGRSWLP